VIAALVITSGVKTQWPFQNLDGAWVLNDKQPDHADYDAKDKKAERSHLRTLSSRRACGACTICTTHSAPIHRHIAAIELVKQGWDAAITDGNGLADGVFADV
jgi:hypothetical protein